MESISASQEDSKSQDEVAENDTIAEAETTTEIPGHEHSYTSEVTKEPTCEADGEGEITYTCSCGHTYTEATNRIDHCTDDIKIVQEATCNQVGIKTYSCIFCGREFEREDYKPMAWEMYYTVVDEIVLSEGITGIGTHNFAGFSKVTSFVFPSTLTSIGKYGMSGMGLTSLEIPRTITKLGHGAFSGMKNMTYLYIPSSIKTIPEYCFGSADNVTKIVIEEGVQDATGDTYGPVTVYGKAGSYVEKWVKDVNTQPEVSFVAK